MSFLAEIKNKLKAKIGNPDLIFSYPPRPELGDLSLACFNLSKNKSSNPTDQALALAKTLKKDKEIMSFFAQITNISILSPDNFSLSQNYWRKKF